MQSIHTASSISLQTSSQSAQGYTQAAQASKGMRIGLWTAQALLAAAFVMAGGMKVSAPIEQLQAQMPWVSGAMGGAVRFIGAVEILGGLGIILPSITRIMPKLTSLAALGLTTVMILASFTHIARGEYSAIVANVILGGMAAFVAWGRWKKSPIQPR